MHIPPEFRPVDPSVRRRASEPGGSASGAASAGPGAQSGDQADLASGLDAGTVERYVSVLKTMNPLNLHRVEDLRQRIADGSYSTDPDELADLLLGGSPRERDADRPGT